MGYPVEKAAERQAQNLDFKNMANAIRALAMDAVQKANSGHPGMPMGMADVATVLFSKFLKFDPKNPRWPNRDRFILSGGHGSMLLYALGYLTGYEKMTLEEIKNFRQMGAVTAGHPEYDVDAAIEMTTGPLGQGISSAPGFALAERILNERYGDDLVDHYTYVFAGDGDLMEGISHEASSFAGHMNLSKLIVLYDQNSITIDGSTDLSFTEDVPKRYEAYGWDVQSIDGHNYDEIESAIETAKETGTPSLICCRTHIGFGAPTKQDSSSAHGAPLGEEEIAGARKNLGWPYPPFEIPEDILAMWRSVGVDSGGETSGPEIDLSALDKVVESLKKTFAEEKPKKATRQTSGMCLEKLVPKIDSLIGGSADLTGSNNTKVGASKFVDDKDYGGNYINYGVREHGMAAIMNGLALHGGFIPYAGTFLQFADYARPAIRLAALMKQRVIHVMTHDSIGLGEDGPTHQPVEHLASLRAIPNTYVFRPCDGVETAECWELAIKKETAPSILALTRQGLPTLREDDPVNKSSLGAYILEDCEGETPEVTIFASGSEVHLAMEAAERLGPGARVVSVPCMDIFWEQDGEYIGEITCNASVKVAVEAGIRQGWDSFIGPHGIFIGMKGFGESAPADALFKHFGITTDAIVEAVEKKLNN
ncbi:MAG: transketolase [Rhodospirillales bacterium]|nr:transketolase [Alphaproteobacteria bacterium]USO03207.1 MAG: transketolase [Rhodospirillales bacterium]